MKKVIILSGTPGTGKTKVAKSLADELNAIVIDINKEVIETRLYSKDENRDTKIADLSKLQLHLVEKVKDIKSGYIIIEGHYADIIPNELVDKAIILRTNPHILENRLKDKNFSNDKIE